MEVAKELEERGISVGKFRPVIQHPIPPKPADFDTKQGSMEEWKKEAGIALEKR